jgi:beta-phosphoglucomutase-like phosphatase (HAD superfamily)
MGIPPSRSVVLEDSPSGVAAAIAAGMTVIGILAASHIQRDQRERLCSAGAQHVAQSFEEAEGITRRLFAAMQ